MAKTPVSTPRPDDRAAFEACLDFSMLLKGGRVAANWMADGRFWFVEGAPNQTIIRTFDPHTGACEPLFDVPRVRAALKAATGREPPYQGLPFEVFAPTPDGGAAFSFEGDDYVLNADGDAVATAPKPNGVDLLTGAGVKARTTPKTFVRPSYFGAEGEVAEVLSPDGRWFAGVKDHNLYLRSTADGRHEQVTKDGEHDCGWDVETPRVGIAQGGRDFIVRGVNPWSPDGLKLFATKFDQRGGGVITHTQLLKRTDEVERTAWTRSGEKLPETVPFIIDIMSRRAIRLDVDTVDRMLLFLGWAKDSVTLYFVQFSRDMMEATVFAADASTGATRKLFSEQGDSFIRIQHEIFFGRSGCTLLPDGSGFLWQSERDGWSHLYRYDMAGQMVCQLTQGEWPVIEVASVDEGAGVVYFTAHFDQDRPYDVHLCRVPMAGGKIERLTDGEGVHDIQMAPDFDCFVDTVSRSDVPPRSTVRNSSGKALHQFQPMDASALEAIGWTAPEEFSVKAADGVTDLWGILYKPRDFDAKSYPVIEYIYGGPQISMAPHAFQTRGAGMMALTAALPQLGYVCVILDARGTPERSKAFQDVTLREWRRHVTADHTAALKALAQDRPWMNLGRVGIWGHSWGGYFTFACMIDAPEVYRAGVSSAPGYDPYDLFIYEPYLGGVPATDNKAAYDDALLFPEAPRLQGRLMIVAGSNDIGVWTNAVKMTNALIEARKDHEMVMLPGQHHGFGALHSTYFIDKLVGHFDRYVKRARDNQDA